MVRTTFEQQQETEKARELIRYYRDLPVDDYEDEFDPTPDPCVDGYVTGLRIVSADPNHKISEQEREYPLISTREKEKKRLTPREHWAYKTRPLPLRKESNKAMALAKGTNFESYIDQLRLPGESKPSFMFKVEAIVEHFAPQNKWQLMALFPIVDLQLKIERLSKAQVQITSNDTAASDNGLSRGMNKSLAIEKELKELRQSLDAAMKTYYQ